MGVVRLRNPAAVEVADRDHDDPGGCHGGDLRDLHCARRGHQAVDPAPSGLQPHEARVTGYEQRGDDPPEGRAELPVLDVDQHRARHLHRPAGLGPGEVVEDVEQDPLEREQPSEGHHERRDLQTGDDGPLDQAEEAAEAEPGENRRPPRPVVQLAVQYEHHRRPARGVVADRQVDLAEQQDEHLGHPEQHEVGGLGEQVGEVGGRDEVAVLGLEDHHDHDQAGDHRQVAGVTGADPAEPRPQVVAGATRRGSVDPGVL